MRAAKGSAQEVLLLRAVCRLALLTASRHASDCEGDTLVFVRTVFAANLPKVIPPGTPATNRGQDPETALSRKR